MKLVNPTEVEIFHKNLQQSCEIGQSCNSRNILSRIFSRNMNLVNPTVAEIFFQEFSTEPKKWKNDNYCWGCTADNNQVRSKFKELMNWKYNNLWSILLAWSRVLSYAMSLFRYTYWKKEHRLDCGHQELLDGRLCRPDSKQWP